MHFNFIAALLSVSARLVRFPRCLPDCVRWLMVIGALTCAKGACGQISDVPPVVPSGQDPQFTIPEFVSPQPDTQQPPIANSVPWPAPGYWIVSTRSSPQSFDDSPPVFRPVVTRYHEGQGYHRSNMQELTSNLIPGLPVCIVVHGSFMDVPSVAPESCATWRWLRGARPDLPFQMIYFSWPSDESLTSLIGIDIAILGNRAARNGFYLASLIQSLPPESPLCLVGHSYGALLITSSLHLMGGGVVEGYRHSCANCHNRRIRSVFLAAALDHDWMNPGQRYDRALCCTECLLNLRNCKDPALCIYPLRRLGSSRALGKSGFTPKDRLRLQASSCKVTDVDVSAEIGHRHMFPQYFNRPGMAVLISNYVYFPDEVPAGH